MSATGERVIGRRCFLGGLGALFAADSPFDPEIDDLASRKGYVVPDAIQYLGGMTGVWVPLWLHDGRVTVNRYRRSDRAQNDPGIGIIYEEATRTSDAELPPAWSVQMDGVYFYNRVVYAPVPRPNTTVMRVIDAHDGRVVFTSSVPELFLVPQRKNVGDGLTLSTMTHIQCGAGRAFSRLFTSTYSAPYEEYFDDRVMPVQRAVPYRNALRKSSWYSGLVRALNPDFYEWFWRRVSVLPELPSHPIMMCHEAGELWSTLVNTYV